MCPDSAGVGAERCASLCVQDVGVWRDAVQPVGDLDQLPLERLTVGRAEIHKSNKLSASAPALSGLASPSGHGQVLNNSINSFNVSSDLNSMCEILLRRKYKIQALHLGLSSKDRPKPVDQLHHCCSGVLVGT